MLLVLVLCLLLYEVGEVFDYWFILVNECMFLVWVCIVLVFMVVGVVLV